LFAVDTNILLYAAISEFPEHKKATALFKKWIRKEESWVITWNIVYEFLRVSTHAAVFERPLRIQQAWDFLNDFIQGSNLSILAETKEHERYLSQLIARHDRISANVIHDFHTAVILFEHGIRTLYTADTDFLQFSFLEVIDPVH
jgi:toxin-antitoxin system PIN domain toxin